MVITSIIGGPLIPIYSIFLNLSRPALVAVYSFTICLFLLYHDDKLFLWPALNYDLCRTDCVYTFVIQQPAPLCFACHIVYFMNK